MRPHVAFRACVDSEAQDQVKNLRILAIRSEPPELRVPFSNTFAGGGMAIPQGSKRFTASALVVDAQGAPRK